MEFRSLILRGRNVQQTPPVFAARKSSQTDCGGHANSFFSLPDNGVSLRHNPFAADLWIKPSTSFNNTSPNRSTNLIFLLVESILLFVSSEYSLRQKAAHLHGLFAISLTRHGITAEEYLFLHRIVNQNKNLKSVFVAYDVATPSSNVEDQQKDKASAVSLTGSNSEPKESSSSEGNESKNQPSETGGNNNKKEGNDPFQGFPKSHSNESGGSGSGGSNHSSGMLSIGNNSFNFNFDSDPMMHLGGSSSGAPSEKTSDGDNSDNGEKPRKSSDSSDANAAADANVASLQMLARSQVASGNVSLSRKRDEPEPAASSQPQQPQAQSQQQLQYQQQHNQQSMNDGSVASNEHEDEDDYDEDDHQSRASTSEPGQQQSTESPQPKRRKKRLDERKRVERNAREKERSFRISKQINELRSLLSSGGVIVPKGTKSSVLTEAANYIRMLQQHQYRSEIDRHQLIQQVQLIGGGAHGSQAAQAVRHVAAQNGVWSLGNFGGMPPKSALLKPSAEKSAADATQEAAAAADPNTVNTGDYRFIFNSCGVGMAIASMGGAFIDCNQLFCQLSNYTKQEVCSLTIFNLTARQDLQHAFDLISQLISPPMEGPVNKAISVRGSFKSRSDLGLCVNIVKGEDGIAKCFCVTIIKNPNSPFDNEAPVPVSFESIITDSAQGNMTKAQGAMAAAPAFTSG